MGGFFSVTATILYDAGDLTTHAVCVGMTGSGKTGLGITLIEEAAIDGIPIIAIDPKGDLGNLLLTFPELTPGQFRPWIDEAEAARHGRTPDAQARWTADLWRKGLASTGQGPERIRRFADAVERTVYTPGSRAGAPLSILRSMAAPAAAVMEDDELRRERVRATVSSLLGLLGIDADPITSREHIFLSTLLDRAWGEGRDVDLPSLIHQIQKPGFERVGVMDLESVFPASDRRGLAMAVNNLIASPGFEVWTEGEPLDIGRLLYTADGRPRLSIVSIAHLSDAERMFVVTSLLNEIVSWVRAQPGSRSLRALLYMDEIFGYMPPVAEPPSKRPLLTLLKQARAQGLGLVLATQNPVDLDCKGLSNAGTWFLGRLQTERDKGRVIEGLEGASAQAGATFDRPRMERLLAGLGSRVFLMNNVHEDAPVVFRTRWALSYLSDPLTRDQLTRLHEGRDATAPPAGARSVASDASLPASSEIESPDRIPAVRPVVPSDVIERFLPVTHPAGAGEQLVYRAGLGAVAMLHYSKATVGVDEWTQVVTLAPLPTSASTSPWTGGKETSGGTPVFDDEPEPDAGFAPIPPAAQNAKTYQRWRKMHATHLYRSRPLQLWRCRKPKLVSLVGESAGAFRGRLGDALRQDRDLRVEKLRKRYAPKLTRLQDQVTRAQQRIEVEQSQYNQKKMQTAISFGATVVGALFGRKLRSVGTVGRAATAMRGAGRAAKERGDIARAGERLETLQERLVELEDTCQGELDALRGLVDTDALTVTEVKVSAQGRPRHRAAAVGMDTLAGGARRRRPSRPWRDIGSLRPSRSYQEGYGRVMKRGIVSVVMSACVVLGGSAVASAQLTAARQGPVVYGHHHLNVASIEEHKTFWVDTLGGEAISVGPLEVIKFPNVLVFLREQPDGATGGTKGTTVNHIGFSVPNVERMVQRLSVANYPIVTRAELPASFEVNAGRAYVEDQDTYIAFAMAPDDVKVEFIEDQAQSEPVALHHIHFAGPVAEMKDWYVQTFGAVPGMRGSFEAADLPGVNLTYSPSAQAPAGTQGRSLDHIGFEVDDLEAFCQELEARGIEFDRPYTEVPALGLSIAFFTDPFGTYIELTEGLDAL